VHKKNEKAAVYVLNLKQEIG